MPYSMNNWWEEKKLCKYNNIFFLLLDNELTKEFYKSKIRLIPLPDPSPQKFIDVL
jgi:hypothetical protein